MVWRIHFTADDLARIRVGPTLGPLAETVMAVSVANPFGCGLNPQARRGLTADTELHQDR